MKYRIVCKGIDKFCIESQNKWPDAPWDTLKDYRGSYPGGINLYFKTDEECEEYIRDLIVKNNIREERQQRVIEFINNHPPREVPPYKF